MCSRGDIFVNKDGLYDPPSINSGNPYYKLLCIVNDDTIKVVEMYYPFIYFSSSEQLQDILKIGKKVDKEDIYYIQPLQKEMPDGEKIMVVYKKDNENDAYLFTFFLDYQDVIFNEEPASKFKHNMIKQYIFRHIQGYSDDVIRGIIKFNYYRGGMLPKLVKKYNVLYPIPLLDNFDEAKRRYEFIKKEDNFKDFEKKYKEIKTRATQIIEKTKESNAFKKYKTMKPNHKYVFPQKYFEKIINKFPELNN